MPEFIEPPRLDAEPCDQSDNPVVCISIESAVQLAKWATEVQLIREALAGCSYIEWTAGWDHDAMDSFDSWYHRKIYAMQAEVNGH